MQLFVDAQTQSTGKTNAPPNTFILTKDEDDEQPIAYASIQLRVRKPSEKPDDSITLDRLLL